MNKLPVVTLIVAGVFQFEQILKFGFDFAIIWGVFRNCLRSIGKTGMIFYIIKQFLRVIQDIYHSKDSEPAS